MIVGTAGHVDHGKSALVRALTGVDPDRLAEEKRRGITIDLGFAYMPAADDAVIGFVDVPGHENFIRTMLAGATGIDFVLLTVAADDGIKPQTVEHVAILDLLGARRGLVALTKADLVPPARQEEVTAAVRELLAPTGLARADIVATSTVTGEGIEALRQRLVCAAKEAAPRTGKDMLFRLAIDRCFTLRGVGTVVTGTVLSGEVAVSDQITISPAGLAARVRSIHAQNRPAPRGRAGQRCALALAGDGIAKDAIARGDMALDPALHAPTARIDAALTLLPGETVTLWQPVRLHHGAAEIGARIVPLGEAWAQLVLERPIAASVGDRFVLRDNSGRRTIGGGRLVDLRAPARHRRTPERLSRLAALAEADPMAALDRLLETPPFAVDLDAFRRDRALSPGFAADRGLIRLAARGTQYVLTHPRWAELAQAVRMAVAAFHVAHPDADGAPPDRLRRTLSMRLSAPLFTAVLAEMARQQSIVTANGVARLPQHASRLTAEQAALWHRLEPLFGGEARFRPPRLTELEGRVAGAGELRTMMKHAAKLGLVEEVAPDHFFLRGAVAEAAAIVGVLAEAAADGQFGAADLRDRLDTGRKNAIELLEFFDRHGVTIRRGDRRRIDAAKLARFAPSRTP